MAQSGNGQRVVVVTVGTTEAYYHPEFDLMLQPEVETQPQFRKRRPPATHHYGARV